MSIDHLDSQGAAPADASNGGPTARAEAPERLTDAELCEAVAERMASPKLGAADSFVLHAPLELLARSALLPLVAPAERGRARDRLAWLGATYAEAGPEIPPPEPLARGAYDSPRAALARLTAAIAAGDLDGVDAPARWLAAALPAAELAQALAAPILSSLGAAAHGSIFLWQLPRVGARSGAAARMLRSLARELAREPDWFLTWHRGRDATMAGSVADDGAALVDVLLSPRSPGDPGSNFIYPTMSIVERSGLAAELLDAPTRSLDPARAGNVLSRVAAWSMLQDDPAQAPYGWTHCLSMPQAVLGVARGACDRAYARDAVAVAATYVLGFRATLGKVALDPAWEPDRPPHRDWLGALEGSPGEAAASAWHAPRETLPAIVAALAGRAAAHHDAHLAKYTVACLDAAQLDPESSRLFFAAAAFLSAWWAQQPEQAG